MEHKQLINKIKKLERLVNFDDLTGVYNLRHFKATLKNELYRAKRYKRDLSLIIVDVDNLKKINDNNGHTGGDKIIKLVAKLLLGSTRKSNVVCRYGGDEFVIILPETNKEQAYELANRIKAKINENKLTVSMGIASFPNDGKTSKCLFDKADKALYKAKETKDTICIYKG